MAPMRMTRALSSSTWVLDLVALALILFALPARADEERRLLLVSADPALEHSVSSALRPWSITIVRSSDPNLGPTMPLAASQAKALAEREHVDGVVWISASDTGPALWTYDAKTDQTTSRALPSAPPYDDEHAASVALSLKTLLRSTQVAPVIERIAAPATTTATTAKELEPPPPPVPSKKKGDVPSPRPQPSRSEPESAWTGDATFGVRFAATNQAIAEPRLAIAAGRRWGRVGVALFGSFGPGIDARSADFTFRLTDASFGARGRFALSSSQRFVVALDGLLGAHVLHLIGDAGTPRTSVSDTRFDASLAGGLFFAFRPARYVSIGAGANAGVMFLRQQYFVSNMLAFDERPGFVEITVGVGVEL